MPDFNQQEDLPLEVRMRNLILKNSEKTKTEGAAVSDPRPSTASASSQVTNIASQVADIPIRPKGRKRLNQAQRRQMSSQLSIPIEPRSVQPQPNHSSGNAAGQNYRHDPQSRNQRPQSAAFQSNHMNSAFPTGGTHQSHPRHQPSPSYPGFSPQTSLFDWRQPAAVQTGFSGTQYGPTRPNHTTRGSMGQGGSLYSPRQYHARPEEVEAQATLLEQLCASIIADAEIEPGQIREKENFRLLIEDACRVAIARYEATVSGRSDFPPLTVQLRCFGSLSSGFATRSSDMDLGLLSPFSHTQPDYHGSPIPRLIERTFLDMGLGARLLSKTRVPIIKVCQRPSEKLYCDLVEERTKWERGVEDEHDLEDEDDAADRPASNPSDINSPVGKGGADGDTHAIKDNQPNENFCPVDSNVEGSEQYQTLLDELRQGAKSLPNYYVAAKKLLRKLGGRDITNSTAANFGANDYRILNDVCMAFIRGLADDNLRTRLAKYASLSFNQASHMPSNRSIFGVMIQVEGEKIVMAWESREIPEKDENYEQLGSIRINQWRDLQNKPTFGLDPLAYNKELQAATELLKKLPSVGLLLLEQGQYEPAALYHSRTIRTMIELGGHDLATSQSPVLPMVIRQYIHGIHDQKIRAQVSDFLRSITNPTLRAVARRHKSLQLAREFEKALEKGLYSTECVEDVRSYINLLRQPMIPNSDGDVHFDFMLPMTPDSWALVAKMRQMSDPSRMSPNQPRDPYKDRLEFPKSGVGVQCDINFSAHLALQNTHLLRCYSHTDARVRPLVLFVKHWAKVRGINTPYRGTLSSYGYVLMVLHYLVNVARPFVCPNLQLMAPPVDQTLTPEQIENTVQCRGRDVRFWRDENQIASMAQQGKLNQNKDSIGHLLRGFFEYYAQNSMMSAGHMRGFDWGRDVISLRTHGGILSKQEKGWTGAKTVVEVRSTNAPPATEPDMPQANPKSMADEQNNCHQDPAWRPLQSPDANTAIKPAQDRGRPEVKEIRHRFLFAIEDPFELEHNVARTVTHNGIVSIRDEFRRAWRIIKNAGKSTHQESLLQDVSLDNKADSTSFTDLLDEIHKPPS